MATNFSPRSSYFKEFFHLREGFWRYEKKLVSELVYFLACEQVPGGGGGQSQVTVGPPRQYFQSPEPKSCAVSFTRGPPRATL